MPRALVLAALLLLPLLRPLRAQEPPASLRAEFHVNDALVKDRDLEGVRVVVRPADPPDAAPLAEGQTDAQGRFVTQLPPGDYRVSLLREGFVELEATSLTLRQDGQVVTTSLLPLGEPDGDESPAVRIVLNWGSDPLQARDVDSHLACPGTALHVYYGRKEDSLGSVSLDVDDTDWGGPETITLQAPPGTYVSWIQNYSGSPPPLGASDVVVRVILGNAPLAELRCPPAAEDIWLPWKELRVDAAGELHLVEWTPEELAAGAPFALPAGVQEALRLTREGRARDDASPADVGAAVVFLVISLVVFGQVLRLALGK